MALEISLQEAFESKPLILHPVGAKQHENSLSHTKNVSREKPYEKFSNLTKTSVPKMERDWILKFCNSL